VEEVARSLKKETLPAAQGEVSPQLISAAASTAPGCPGCLKLAGQGKILQWLSGRA